MYSSHPWKVCERNRNVDVVTDTGKSAWLQLTEAAPKHRSVQAPGLFGPARRAANSEGKAATSVPATAANTSDIRATVPEPYPWAASSFVGLFTLRSTDLCTFWFGRATFPHPISEVTSNHQFASSESGRTLTRVSDG